MPRILALEDDARRIGAFRSVVRSVLRGFELLVFVDAPEMINWLSINLNASDILSLDRDLDATSVTDRNCGTGEDVTDFLIQQSIRPPIVIHSSNGLRAPAMHLELAMAGFQIVLLCPFRGEKEWADDILLAKTKYESLLRLS